MKEIFMHYIWQYKLFDFKDLITEQGEKLQIIHSGAYLQQEGPDFFNGIIILNGQKWAGNIEIHVHASDWYLHHHEKDENYNSVILHVVWDDDIPVLRIDQTPIPVLLLSKYVDRQLLEKYAVLNQKKNWIYCEDFIGKMPVFTRNKWLETLFFERLEHKVRPISNLAVQTKLDWETVFYCFIAQGFGLNINGGNFLNLARSLPIEIIKKERLSVENLEALFFGKTNLLKSTNEDTYSKDLLKTWNFLSYKYQLQNRELLTVQFFKVHPDNFPTIRLSQFSNLLHKYPSLFDVILQCQTKEDYYKIFDVSTSDYWVNHYVMDKISPAKKKKTTTAFIDLLIINTVIPLKYIYHRSKGEDCSEFILDLIISLRPERNNIIDYFIKLDVVVENAFDTQSLLQLKKHYCDHKRCLSCGIGRAYLYNDDL